MCAQARLISTRCSREVGAAGVARHIGVATAIQRDPIAIFIRAAAQVSAVEQTAARRVQLDYERIRNAVQGHLVSARRGRKVGSLRVARDVGASAAVQRDAVGDVIVASFGA